MPDVKEIEKQLELDDDEIQLMLGKQLVSEQALAFPLAPRTLIKIAREWLADTSQQIKQKLSSYVAMKRFV